MPGAVNPEDALSNLLAPHMMDCDCCQGTGRTVRLTDVAQVLRAERLRRGIGQKLVAYYAALSPSYINDLELNRRSWSVSLIERYWRALVCVDGGKHDA